MLINFLIFIIIYLGLCTPCSAFGARVIRLSNLTEPNVSQHFEIFRDTSRMMDLDAVRIAEFQRIEQVRPNFGFSQDVLWLRASIDTEGSGERILLIDYPLLDHIDLFLLSQDTVIRSVKLGDADDRRPGMLVGTFPLPAQKGTYEIYLRITSDSSLHVPLAIMDFSEYGRHKTWNAAILFGIISILGAMTLFHVFVLLQTGSLSYLYYVLFVFSIFVFELLKSGAAQDILWSESVNDYLLPKLGLLNSIFGALFTQRFLGFRGNYPRFQKVLRASAWFGVGLLLLSHSFSYGLSIRITGLFGIYTSILLFSYGGTLVYTERNLMARYYMTAWALFLAGVVVFIITQFAFLPLNLFTQNAMVFGAVAEVLLLSLALGARYQMVQSQNSQLKEHRLALQMELKQELLSRITLVSELAHRMNNPLNYVRTATDAGRTLWSSLEKDTKSLIESSIEANDPEGQLLYQNFASRFEEMGQWFALIEKGTEKSTRSIAEIRNLSGVDGYSLEHIELTSVWKDVWERVEADLGTQKVKKIEVKTTLPSNAYMLGNSFSLVVVFDSLLKEWSRLWPEGFCLSFVWIENGGLARFEIKIDRSDGVKPREILRPETLKHISFILKPYTIKVHVSDEGSIVLENQTFVPLKQEHHATGTSIAAA